MQVLLSTLCLALTSAVVGNAYLQKKQFYPAVVYITKSNASMAVIYIQFFVIVFMFGKLLRRIFLGTLRAAEFEHLLERFWYALTETCLAFTVFRDDFNPRFVALFTVLLFLKSFHWLAEERVDFMERSPVLGWLFHIRVASLLVVLGILDYMLLMHAYESTLQRGPTVQLVFGFEYAILLTVVLSTTIKYVLHTAEMRTDTPWENKAVFLLYTELVIGLIKVILYVLFVVIMAKIYALPMFVFRPMFFTIRNFKKAFSDVIMSRRAIRNMNTLYPDATPEELRLSDNICIICREDMVSHSKKLPCGHIFHTTCLRSWFQRQQTCPTCRLNILRTPNANSTAIPRAEDPPAAATPPAAGAPPAAATAGAAANANTNTNATATGAPEPARADIIQPVLGTGIFENLAGAVGFPAAMNFPSIATAMMPPTTAPPPPPPPPFMLPPPFPFIAPYGVPPPPMPVDLTTFTDEELKAMEGNERSHIEERIKLLRNIQLMLDAAGILMTNYQIVTAQRMYPPATAATAATDPAAATPAEATAATTATAATSVAAPSPPAAQTDGPSTSSAAAAAAAAFAASLHTTAATLTAATSSSTAKEPTTAATTATTSQPDVSASPSSSSASPVATGAVTVAAAVSSSAAPATAAAVLKHNEVTIEDLGGEEHEFNVAKSSTATAAATTTTAHTTASSSSSNNNTIIVDGVDNADLNELRQRRLKFLQERNKEATASSAD